MARINIEDAIFKENRYTDLCIAAGSRRMALGALTELWIEAQKFYLTHGEIPIGEWAAARAAARDAAGDAAGDAQKNKLREMVVAGVETGDTK